MENMLADFMSLKGVIKKQINFSVMTCKLIDLRECNLIYINCSPKSHQPGGKNGIV